MILKLSECTLFTIMHFFGVVFRQIAPEELNVSGFNFSQILAVVNFANINSNEQFCPVGNNGWNIMQFTIFDYHCRNTQSYN